jgi:hypothetical protein
VKHGIVSHTQLSACSACIILLSALKSSYGVMKQRASDGSNISYQYPVAPELSASMLRQVSTKPDRSRGGFLSGGRWSPSGGAWATTPTKPTGAWSGWPERSSAPLDIGAMEWTVLQRKARSSREADDRQGNGAKLRRQCGEDFETGVMSKEPREAYQCVMA